MSNLTTSANRTISGFAAYNFITHANKQAFKKSPFDFLNYFPLIKYDGELQNFAKVKVNKNDLKTTDFKKNDNGFFDVEKYSSVKLLTIEGIIDEQLKYWKLNRKSRKNYLSESLGAILNIRDKDARIITRGDMTGLSISGTGTNLAMLGACSNLSISADTVQGIVIGRGSNVVSTGDFTRVITIGANCSITISGNDSYFIVNGDHSTVISTGSDLTCTCNGKNGSIFLTGKREKFRGIAGTLVSCTVYDPKSDNGITNIINGRIGQDGLKPNTWYVMENNKFVEVVEHWYDKIYR